MRPKEKARNLTQWFYDHNEHTMWQDAKDFATKICDEIIAEFKSDLGRNVTGHYKIDYWQTVKSEIEKL